MLVPKEVQHTGDPVEYIALHSLICWVMNQPKRRRNILNNTAAIFQVNLYSQLPCIFISKNGKQNVVDVEVVGLPAI